MNKPIVHRLDEATPAALEATPFLTSEDFSPPSAEPSPPIQWGEPLTFDSKWAKDLSADFLPDWLREYVLALSKSTQTPVGLALMVVLATVAACIQKKFEISPTGDDYREPINFWTVSVKPPATGKSPVFNQATKPLIDWERDQALTLKSEIDQQNARNEIADKRIEELKKAAAKLDDEHEREQKARETADLESKKSFDVKAPRVWTGDVTPERLQGLLCDHLEKMAVLTSEGGIFEILSGLYSNGHANIDVFLKSHSGDPLRVDRAERTVILYRPALSFGLTVQPAILTDLGSGGKQKLRQNGCLARFIYDMSAPNIGTRKFAERVGMPPNVALKYAEWLRALLNIPLRFDENGNALPGIITLTDGAREEWVQFADSLERHQGEGGRFENIQDWTGKLAGQALRLVALAHVAEHFKDADSVPIDRAPMKAVTDFCGELIPHAQMAFELMSSGQSLQDAKFAFGWMNGNTERNDNGAPVIRQQHLHGSSRFKNGKLDRVSKALEILQERNIVFGPMKSATKGRPQIVWLVNPALINAEVAK